MLGPGCVVAALCFWTWTVEKMKEYVLARVDEKHGVQAFVEVFYGVGGA